MPIDAPFQQITVTFTHADAIAINTTPVTLLSAQGPNTKIVPLAIALHGTNTTAYNATTTLQVRYTSSSKNLISVSAPWSNATNQTWNNVGTAENILFNTLTDSNHDVNADVHLLATSAVTGGASGDSFSATLWFIVLSV